MNISSIFEFEGIFPQYIFFEENNTERKTIKNEKLKSVLIKFIRNIIIVARIEIRNATWKIFSPPPAGVPPVKKFKSS